MANSSGLQSHIWDNNIRSLIFLALYPLIILALVWACAYIFAAFGGSGLLQQKPAPPMELASTLIAAYWPIILAVVLIWFAISFFFNTAMIRALSHAHTVKRTEEPALYNMLENLCISRGMKMPQLNIIETHARNAFASGIDDRSYTVTVTRGLMNSLKPDEMEGVLAHELMHIINRDVRLLMITVVFTGLIGFAAQLIWSSVRWNLIAPSARRREEGGGGIIMALLAVAAILWIGYFATLFMRFAISRRREYMADAGAVELTKNPEAMMRALMRIAGRDQIPATPADVMMMCLENAQPFMGLFATHPPIEKRIKALSQMTNTPVPDLPHHGPAEAKEAFSDRSRANPWLTRSRGGR